ncbi:hypothetical protein E2I00_011310, partial [Balaenoptera physalus]
GADHLLSQDLADPCSGLHRFRHDHPRDGLGLRGLALLLLRHLQHHRLRGSGEQPARRLPEPGALPPGQLPLHPAR